MSPVFGRAREFRGRRFLTWLAPRKIPFRRSPYLYWTTLSVILLLDQATKWAVMHWMVLGQSRPLLGQVLKLTYVRNAGAAFSLLADFHSPWRLALLIAIPLLAFGVLTYMVYRDHSQGSAVLFPMGMVSGGALGNLVDRSLYGTVVDFIEFSYRNFHWPVFNLADSAVVVGVGWLLLLTSGHPKTSG